MRLHRAEICDARVTAGQRDRQNGQGRQDGAYAYAETHNEIRIFLKELESNQSTRSRPTVANSRCTYPRDIFSPSAPQEKNKYLSNLSLPHFRLISPRPRRFYRSRRTVGPIFLCLAPVLQPLTFAQFAHVAANVCNAPHEPYTRQSAFTFPSIYFGRIPIPLTTQSTL